MGQYSSTLSSEDTGESHTECMLCHFVKDSCSGPIQCLKVCKHIASTTTENKLEQFIRQNVNLYPNIKLRDTTSGQTRLQVRKQNRQIRKKSARKSIGYCHSLDGDHLQEHDIRCPGGTVGSKYRRTDYYHILLCRHHMEVFQQQFNSTVSVRKQNDIQSLRALFRRVNQQWKVLEELFSQSKSEKVREISNKVREVGYSLSNKILAHLIFFCVISLGNIAISNLVRFFRTYASPDDVGTHPDTVPIECTMLQVFRQYLVSVPVKMFIWLSDTETSVSAKDPTKKHDTWKEVTLRFGNTMLQNMFSSNVMHHWVKTWSKPAAEVDDSALLIEQFDHFAQTLKDTDGGQKGDIDAVSASALVSCVLEQAMIAGEIMLSSWLDLFVTGCPLDPSLQYSTTRKTLSNEDIDKITAVFRRRISGGGSSLRKMKMIVRNTLPFLSPDRAQAWKKSFNEIHRLQQIEKK